MLVKYMNSKKRVLILLLLFINSMVSAKTFYVSPTGSDANPGTLAQPWKTWHYAFNHTPSGDTCYFRGGTYKPYSTKIGASLYSPNNNGTRNNPTCFFNYPGEIPELDCQNVYNMNNQIGIGIADAENFHFKGLTVKNVRQIQTQLWAYGWLIWNYGNTQGSAPNNIIFENCNAYNIGGNAFASFGSDSLYFINCDSYIVADSLSTADPGGQGSGFTIYDGSYTDAPNKSYFYFHGCRAWQCSDQGFQIATSGLVVFDSCWAIHNGDMPFHGNNEPKGSGWKFWYNQPSWIDIRKTQVIMRNCIAAFNELFGINWTSAPATTPKPRAHIYNNFVYNNGLDVGKSTSFGNGFNDRPSTDTTGQWDRWYKNNLSYNNMGTPSWGPDGDFITGIGNESNNKFDITTSTISDNDFLSLDTTGLCGPRQPDGSLPFTTFGHLASTSECVDAGTDVGLKYVGSAPDIGWHESPTVSNSPPLSPVYVNSVIQDATPAKVEMTYNLSLANIVPPNTAFTVKVNNVTRSVGTVAVSGNKVLLTLASPVIYGDAVTVAYNKPASNPLQTPSGGQAASMTARTVTNNVAAVIPVYVSSVIQDATPSRVELTYNPSLANIVPSTAAFNVKVNNVTRSVRTVAISGNKVMLTLASPVVCGDVVSVAYTKPASNPLQTTSGGQAASMTAKSVTNNVAAVIPVYVSSVIQDATPARVEMTYNLSLANIVPPNTAFTVKVNNVTRSVGTVAVSGNKVLLTLASPVIYGDVVSVAYTKPASNPLQTPSGGQAASITARNVTNNVAAVNNQPPVVSISSPTKSTAYIAPATITIDANAFDPDGSVIKVEFYNGNIKLGEITAFPYSFTWKEVQAGTYYITAAATDNKGLRTVSAVVSVVVEKPAAVVNQLPSVSIKIKNKKKPKKNDNIEIVAEASDPDGTISKVELKSGNVTIAELTVAPYVFTLQNVDTGIYLFTATATDNLGAVSTSDAIELRVEDFFNPDLISLYPNPNNGFFKIDILEELPEQECTFSITNLTGTTVYQDKITHEEVSKEIKLPDLHPGPYILMLTYRNNILTTKKFIKE